MGAVTKERRCLYVLAHMSSAQRTLEAVATAHAARALEVAIDVVV